MLWLLGGNPRTLREMATRIDSVGDNCESAGDAVWQLCRNAADTVRRPDFHPMAGDDDRPAVVTSGQSHGIAPGGCYPPTDWPPSTPVDATERLAAALEQFADARERIADGLDGVLDDEADELRRGAEDLEEWDRPPICWPPYPPPTRPEFPDLYWRDQLPRTLTTMPDTAPPSEGTNVDA